MVRECGKRDQFGDEAREHEVVRGELMLTEEVRKGLECGDELGSFNMQVEEYTTMQNQPRRTPLNDCTNNQYLGEGEAVTVKKSGTNGQ